MSMFQPPYPEGLPVGPDWLPDPELRPVLFPYDRSEVALAPWGSARMAAQALEFALGVAPAVEELPSHLRRTVLREVHSELAARRQDFESLLVLESGKPLVDCRTEVERSLVTLEVAAEEAGRLHGETVPLDLSSQGEGLLGFWIRKPIGVVIGIAGFNYPLLLASHKIAPAVAAGCPVVVKPAPQTPLATLWLVHLFRTALRRAGAPEEAVQLVTGDSEVGRTLTTDRRVGAVSFTGSARVGHQIARDAAPTKVVLELGSNSALVVCADAVIRGGYYASGQACISVQRVLVVEAVRDRFLELLSARLAQVVVGDPRQESTRVSALIDEPAALRVGAWVREAISGGARLLAGGEVSGGIVAPTAVADVPSGIPLWDEEVFGPVVCIRTVAGDREALEEVNRSRYGLHASVFTSSLATAMAALSRLKVGGVVINDVPGFRADNMPYGGVKDSGVGREGPRFAVEELTVTRMAIIRPSWPEAAS